MVDIYKTFQNILLFFLAPIIFFSFSDKIMATAITTSDNSYFNGSSSSNFKVIRDWFQSFQVSSNFEIILAF